MKSLSNTYFRSLTGAVVLAITLTLGIGSQDDGLREAVAETKIGILVDQIPFQVELAKTAAARQRGLMFRRQLPAGHGMLFIQPQAGPVAFWMKNTLIPLDILYFDSQGQLLEIYADVPPCTTPSCPLYPSSKPIKYILELNAGRASELGLEPGARLRLD